MKTLYIDVYFLVNFTVDLLSIYFASRISKVNIRGVNIFLIALLGAVYGVLNVLIPAGIAVDILMLVITTALVLLCIGRGVSFFRRVKIFISFIILMSLIGGLVYFFYSIMSKYIEYKPTEAPENRKLLILSILIIISFGVIKLISIIFARSYSEKSVRLSIKFIEKSVEFDALVDTGNLLIDPIDSTPVMLITQGLADKIITTGVPREIGSVTNDLKKYVRIIPVSKGTEHKIYIGFLPDSVELKKKNKWERIKLIFVVEPDSTGYGGYEALAPASVLG